MGRKMAGALAAAGLLLILGAVLLLGVLAVRRGLRSPAVERRAAPAPSLSGVVEYVYDGDTIEVSGVGKVRVLGIDTPDGHNEEKTAAQASRYGLTPPQVRRWAEEATGQAIARLKGRRVVLEIGGDRRDDYGRTLAYVHVGEGERAEDFGLFMLEHGFAAAYRSGMHRRRAAYLAAEETARAAGAGMWRDARPGS
ncbi:MAG: hypothetical protein GXY85_10580 [Candidatus Brocadiaceae bacterium]|nr:hypothetical protein [Candidatus Brocadiaceae bacterium]